MHRGISAAGRVGRPKVARGNAKLAAKAADEVAQVAEAHGVSNIRDAHVLAVRPLQALSRRIDAALENVAARRAAHLAEDALDATSTGVQLLRDPSDVQIGIAE